MSLYLFIDTSIPESVRVALYDGNKLAAKKVTKVGLAYSEKTLAAIDSLLSKSGSGLANKLQGIFVVAGPGRFSALRTGVTAANVLGWSQGVPVLGVQNILDVNIAKDNKKYWQAIEQTISKAFKKIRQHQSEQFIVPAYGKEPNISKPKAR